MAESCQVPSRWEDTSRILEWFQQAPADENLLGNQLPNTEESVLQNQSSHVSLFLIVRNQVDCHGTAQALSIDDEFGVFSLGALAQIIQSCLRIEFQTSLIRDTGRQSIAPVLQHKDIAVKSIVNDLGDGHPMTDIAGIPVEHQNREVSGMVTFGGAQEQGMQGFTVGRRDLQVFEIRDTELARARHIGPGIDWDVAGVYQLAGKIH